MEDFHHFLFEGFPKLFLINFNSLHRLNICIERNCIQSCQKWPTFFIAFNSSDSMNGSFQEIWGIYSYCVQFRKWGSDFLTSKNWHYLLVYFLVLNLIFFHISFMFINQSKCCKSTPSSLNLLTTRNRCRRCIQPASELDTQIRRTN